MRDIAVSRDDIYKLHSFQVDRPTGFRAERLATLPRTKQRDDHDVCREVQRALTLDRLVPLSVVARVRDGVVTLRGAVSRHAERDDALILASGVPGVLGIMDELVLIPPPRLGDADVGAHGDADATE
jgi:osmotically-inducible protein OsmY